MKLQDLTLDQLHTYINDKIPVYVLIEAPDNSTMITKTKIIGYQYSKVDELTDFNPYRLSLDVANYRVGYTEEIEAVQDLLNKIYHIDSIQSYQLDVYRRLYPELVI